MLVYWRLEFGVFFWFRGAGGDSKPRVGSAVLYIWGWFSPRDVGIMISHYKKLLLFNDRCCWFKFGLVWFPKMTAARSHEVWYIWGIILHRQLLVGAASCVALLELDRGLLMLSGVPLVFEDEHQLLQLVCIQVAKWFPFLSPQRGK